MVCDRQSRVGPSSISDPPNNALSELAGLEAKTDLPCYCAAEIRCSMKPIQSVSQPRIGPLPKHVRRLGEQLASPSPCAGDAVRGDSPEGVHTTAFFAVARRHIFYLVQRQGAPDN